MYFVIALFAAVIAAFLPASYCKNDPILPSDYVHIIKQGFATNYFKTDPPAQKYRDDNIEDVYKRGFRNLRLRARADLYDAPYEKDPKFEIFLRKLEMVVDKCLKTNVVPIISWIHHHAEAYATKADKRNYISWWTLVAKRLKDKDYRLSFNLFTELGIDECQKDCSHSLREDTAKYNEWTKAVVTAIRGTNGNNKERILILTSPKKTAKGLIKIDKSIYSKDKYMMAEFHLYASGPNKKKGSAKYWDGSAVSKNNVCASIQPALEWTKETGIRTYFGAWMAEDNKNMSLNENEIKQFGKFFVETLKEKGIPWSLNVLDRYYDTKRSNWLTKQKMHGKTIDFEKILDYIAKYM